MTDYLDLTTNAQALPTIIAAETLGALRSNMALLGLVNRDFEDEVASYGQIVKVNVRGALTAQDKAEGSNVTIQAPTLGTAVSVTLNKHKEVTIGEEDIATMLQRPDLIAGYGEDAATAILEQIEADIAALYSGFSQSIDALAGLDEEDFRNAQRLLNAAKVPLMGRWAVLHEDAMYEAQGIERIVNRDYAESLGRVQANSYQGNAYGFNIFLDQNIATVEDECSANAQAAWMLSLIRRAAWQRRAEVRCHPVLVAAAQAKADEMARLIYASHTSPTGAGPNDNARAHGYELPEWYAAGGNNVESFAAGFPYHAPEIVLAAWQTSSSHWQHVAALHPFFVGQECAAVGYAYTPGGFYHYWVFLSAPCA